MKKIKFTQRERRIIIILMSINLFALFVNYFELSPKINSGNYTNKSEFFLFTDSKEIKLLNQRGWSTNMDGSSLMYETRHTSHFWPFTKFYEKSNTSGSYIKSRFRGIFADFDHTEFLVYTIIIIGIFIIKKIW